MTLIPNDSRPGVAHEPLKADARAWFETLRDRRMVSLFNWGDQPVARSFLLPGRCRLRDYWTGEDLGVHEGRYEAGLLAARSARLIEVRPAR